MIDYRSLQQILDHSKIYAIVSDRTLHIVDMCEGARAFMFARGDYLGRPLPDLMPELIGSEEQLASIVRGESAGFFLPMVNIDQDDGRVRYFNFTALPHRGADNAIDGIIFVIEDITEMAEIEQTVTQHRNELSLLHGQLEEQNLQLAAANAELRKLDQLKSKFVSIAAHDLRSPLATVSGYLDLLEDEDFGGLTPQQTEFAAVIHRSTDRLLGIIEKLLDISRIAAGRMDLVMSVTDIIDLLALVEDEIMPQARVKDLTLTVYTEADLPYVLCDADRTMQILHNLLLNAVSYTRTGGHIRVGAVLAADPAFVEISVVDDGIGIPLDEQDKIFESFYRASNAYETETSGSGLGLNIARSLVELHGGEIRLESAPGKGTAFHVTFPAVYAPRPSIAVAGAGLTLPVPPSDHES